jgi:hypothetical protein
MGLPRRVALDTMVPCEENASLTVVDGNRGSLMARNRNGIEDPAPQVIDRHLRGPVPKTKERLNRDCLRLHNSGVWAGFELRIARNVIIMCMSVSYDQGDTLAIVPFQPLINLIHYDPSHVGFTCACGWRIVISPCRRACNIVAFCPWVSAD